MYGYHAHGFHLHSCNLTAATFNNVNNMAYDWDDEWCFICDDENDVITLSPSSSSTHLMLQSPQTTWFVGLTSSATLRISVPSRPDPIPIPSYSSASEQNLHRGKPAFPLKLRAVPPAALLCCHSQYCILQLPRTRDKSGGDLHIKFNPCSRLVARL